MLLDRILAFFKKRVLFVVTLGFVLMGCGVCLQGDLGKHCLILGMVLVAGCCF